jgi:hypothetical protein
MYQYAYTPSISCSALEVGRAAVMIHLNLQFNAEYARARQNIEKIELVFLLA